MKEEFIEFRDKDGTLITARLKSVSHIWRAEAVCGVALLDGTVFYLHDDIWQMIHDWMIKEDTR